MCFFFRFFFLLFGVEGVMVVRIGGILGEFLGVFGIDVVVCGNI